MSAARQGLVLSLSFAATMSFAATIEPLAVSLPAHSSGLEANDDKLLQGSLYFQIHSKGMRDLMKLLRLLTLVSFTMSVAPTVWGQGNTQRGTVLGGLTGAAIGAIVGDHNDETAAGAIIGGAVGMLAGSALGNSADQEILQQQAYQQQRYHAISRAVTARDVVSMVHNRVSDDVIISSINNSGMDRELDVSDIIQLHQQGVSDAVIRTMQRAHVAGEPGSTPVARVHPVVVERYHHVVPARVYAYPPPYYRHHGHHCGPRRHSGVGWHMSFGGY